MSDLARHARSLAGTAARVEEDSMDSGRMLRVDIQPGRPDARGIVLVAAHGWLMFSAGHIGGQWELDCEADAEFARDLIASIISGRVEERFGLSRSVVTVTLANGSKQSEIGYDGLSSLVPQPGWKRRGRRIQYTPYR